MAKKQVFLSTIFALCIVFVVGIIIGNLFSNTETKEVDKVLKQSELSTESYLLEQELLADFDQNCDLAKTRLAALSGELWQLGKLLGTETAKSDLGKANYNFLKLKYHLMQVKTYILYANLNKDCNFTTPVVLFFYSQDDADSKEQGKILDSLVEAYNIHVFAVEAGFSKELEFLEMFYGVSETPFLVLNYDIKKPGLTSYQVIESEMQLGE
ncbi:hypothetical protein KY338_00895 [Candidatus Woesearchaeota archaeon]|nr:hypothetical protein [Candidatus Woesearchaeota archaeon]MBW3006154.1 hypothetical protein [Candidatus Woesearchaeota archaeon]